MTLVFRALGFCQVSDNRAVTYLPDNPKLSTNDQTISQKPPYVLLIVAAEVPGLADRDPFVVMGHIEAFFGELYTCPIVEYSVVKVLVDLFARCFPVKCVD